VLSAQSRSTRFSYRQGRGGGRDDLKLVVLTSCKLEIIPIPKAGRVRVDVGVRVPLMGSKTMSALSVDEYAHRCKTCDAHGHHRTLR
jgi:hypothetical protein